MNTSAECEIAGAATAPSGLLDAFWRYDAALLANDRETLNALFLPGPHTLRGDGPTLLVGHEAIAGARSARAHAPVRQVVRVQVQVIARDAALISARTRDGLAFGLQTQLWRLVDGRWLVSAAHVSAPAPAPGPEPPGPLDTRIWRVAGDPLLPPGGTGPLDGIGVAVKDIFAVAGHPVGAGVPAWLAGQAPQRESAPAVQALLAAGAHVAGIARTDEFAYSLAGRNAHYGTPPNPAAPGCVSGGSSSGPASAVALGQAAAGLGTDTAGSIRIPASYQGLVGLRTSHGAVSAEGVLPLAPSFDTVGWLTRDVPTSARIAQALLGRAGPAAAPPHAGPPHAGPPQERPRKALRLPVVESLAEDDVRDGFAAAAGRLSAAGTLPPLATADLPASVLERWFAAFRDVQGFQAWQAHGAWLASHPGALGEDIAQRFAAASRISEPEAAAAGEVVAEARATLRDWLGDGLGDGLAGGLDGAVLVLPTAPGPAPSLTASGADIEAQRAATLRMTCLAPLAGAPAVSLPLLRCADGRPAGLCLIGAPGTDRGLLDLAAGLLEPAG